MIEVQNLTKRFGDTVALDNLSFQMKPGEILGFLGPNGAGKTTTIRILTGYLTPTDGNAWVAGYNLREKSREARDHIGYLPESVPVYREMMVTEYLEFVADLKKVPRASRKNHLDDIMNQCGLGEVRNKLSGHLSKGYRQRLGLAQAMVGNPDILILDEPTSGLDPQQIIEIRELIRDLGGRRTIILSSHILPEVSQLCERVIILNRGRLVAVDTPENLDRGLSSTDSILLEISGGSEPDGLIGMLKNIHQIRTVQPVSHLENGVLRLQIIADGQPDIRPVVARSIVEAGWNLLELHRQTRSLEDIFIQLVTREESVQ
ncbi:ATP-binding cassette domain-containing protein [bacterium]|nr:ATP-binding cassette domain-containing protein [candidate division CSSED10-310 bacterium]